MRMTRIPASAGGTALACSLSFFLSFFIFWPAAAEPAFRVLQLLAVEERRLLGHVQEPPPNQ